MAVISPLCSDEKRKLKREVKGKEKESSNSDTKTKGTALPDTTSYLYEEEQSRFRPSNLLIENHGSCNHSDNIIITQKYLKQLQALELTFLAPRVLGLRSSRLWAFYPICINLILLSNWTKLHYWGSFEEAENLELNCVMGDTVEDEESHSIPVGRWTVFYYGVGHMLNDITAACWFTYLLLFLTDIGLSPRDAAIVMLSGQIADGFATVFAGELIDRFGNFKIWHAAGSVLVAVSFSSVFGGCLPCKFFASNSSTVETISYSIAAAIFNVGWAATQVSHMSMVNCISLNSTSRVVMTSCRNAFNMVANLGLYAVALIVFNVTDANTHIEIENQYRWIAYSSIFIGCCFVGIFLLGTKEPRLKETAHGNGYARISWTYWFKKILYYQVGLVYVLTRLVQNVSQAYLAFYVINDLRMAQSAKALVPAIIYICSFIVSVLMQEISWTGQRLKAYYSAGCILWVLCGAGILLLPRSMNAFMYVMSVAIGIANALMAVTGVSMQSVLVGLDLNGCAFVYGSLSFLDKISCGLALFALQSFQSSSPALHNSLSADHISVTRYGLGLVPAICALIGVAVTYTMKLHEHHAKPLTETLLE